MSNTIAPGSSADVNVKVTALTTNPNVPVTYKTIILKKNLVNGVNTLTQEMMSAQNTKYVIKYDYVLGEDITVPENCILDFDGGSISASGSNDIIIGNNTGISAGLVKVFNTDITLDGTWSVAESYSEWFDAKGDGIADDTLPIIKCLNSFGKLCLIKNVYLTDTIEKNDIYIYSNKNVTAYNSFSKLPILKAKSTTTKKCVIYGSRVRLVNIGIDGNNRLSNGIKGSNLYFSFCTFGYCNCAITGTTYSTNINVIDNCQINNSNCGIAYPVDSRIINCCINACGNGIILGEGCDSNFIENCRIEWCTSLGIDGFKSYYNNIIGCQFDRCSSSAIKLANCVYFTITGNLFRRNGAESSNSNYKTHLFIESSKNIIFADNITATGNQYDNNSGTNVPSYCYHLKDSSKVVISGNNLLGYVTGLNIDTSNNSDIIYTGNTGVNSTDLKKLSQASVNFNSNTTFSVTFETTISIPQYSTPSVYRVDYRFRHSSDNSGAAGSFDILLYNTWGTPVIIASQVYGSCSSNVTITYTAEFVDNHIKINLTSTKSSLQGYLTLNEK